MYKNQKMAFFVTALLGVAMTQWVNFLKRETRVKGQFGHRPSFFLSSLSDGHARRAEALAQLDRDAGAHQPLRPRGQQLHQHPHLRVQGREVPQRPLGKGSSVRPSVRPSFLFRFFYLIRSANRQLD